MISKGMEKETSLLPFQAVEEVLKKKDILHLTGVGYAKEVHKEIPVTEALASRDEYLLKEVRGLLETDWLTIKPSTDLLGTQLAGALKNVMVIGIGLAEGQRENPEIRTGLIEEGVREMIELGKVMGAKEETFWGPAGKGDLEISADPLSRNYKLGQALVERGLDEVQRDLKEKGMTVEGFHTAWAAYQLAKKYGLELPMIEEVYKVIYERRNPIVSTGKLIDLTKQTG
jgi:glycerol-3-phosphate dehydrogenase (NAD(P)+)